MCVQIHIMHKQDKSHLFLTTADSIPCSLCNQGVRSDRHLLLCKSNQRRRQGRWQVCLVPWNSSILEAMYFLGSATVRMGLHWPAGNQATSLGCQMGIQHSVNIPATAAILASGEAPYGNYTPEVRSLKDDFDPDFSRALCYLSPI